MSSYGDPDLLAWMSTLSAIRGQIKNVASFESAAREVVRALYDIYAEATALARVYVVVPYRELDRSLQDAASAMVAPVALLPETPVLTLAASYGALEEWRDRHRSQGHRAIPLASPTFVQGIPMIAGLLHALGAPLGWDASQPGLNTQRLLSANGLFFVDDAHEAKDSEDRLLIPAQDFVAEHGVQTVFGMGGAYADGTLAVVIVFTRERLLRSQIERLTSLVSMLKAETATLVKERKLLEPDDDEPLAQVRTGR